MTTPPTRPTAAFLMFAGLQDLLLGDDEKTRLANVCRTIQLEPFSSLSEIPDEDAEGLSVLITAWGCPLLDAAALAKVPNLKLVAHAAGSVKELATAELFERGIVVTSAAQANAVPVAEFTIAAITMVGKRAFAVRDLHRENRGQTGRKDYPTITGNLGRTIGILGASRIGQLVADRLNSYDYTILISDPFLSDADAEELGATSVDLDELCRRSDVLTIHAPDLPTTRNIIGAEELALLPDGAWVINTARGRLLDHDALLAEAQTGRLNAFLDTTHPEPLPPDSPFYDLPNVILTPHIAGSLGNELQRMGAAATTEVERFTAGLSPLHPITASDLDRIA